MTPELFAAIVQTVFLPVTGITSLWLAFKAHSFLDKNDDDLLGLLCAVFSILMGAFTFISAGHQLFGNNGLLTLLSERLF